MGRLAARCRVGGVAVEGEDPLAATVDRRLDRNELAHAPVRERLEAPGEVRQEVLRLEHERGGGRRQHARPHVDRVADRARRRDGVSDRVAVDQVAHQLALVVPADKPHVAQLAAAQPHGGEQQLDARLGDEDLVDAPVVVEVGDGVQHVEGRALQKAHDLLELALRRAEVHEREPDRPQQDQVRRGGRDLRQRLAQQVVGQLGDLEGECRVVVDGKRLQGLARRVHVAGRRHPRQPDLLQTVEAPVECLPLVLERRTFAFGKLHPVHRPHRGAGDDVGADPGGLHQVLEGTHLKGPLRPATTQGEPGPLQ